MLAASRFCLTVGKKFSRFGQRVLLMTSLSVDDDSKFFLDSTGSDASCADLIRSRLKSALGPHYRYHRLSIHPILD